MRAVRGVLHAPTLEWEQGACGGARSELSQVSWAQHFFAGSALFSGGSLKKYYFLKFWGVPVLLPVWHVLRGLSTLAAHHASVFEAFSEAVE